jgi:hypothetical protein
VRIINGALKFLKNNQAAGVGFITAELLKNGGPHLVDALHEVIRTGLARHYRKAGLRGIVFSVQEGR